MFNRFLVVFLLYFVYSCQHSYTFKIIENPKDCIVGWGDSMMAGSGTEKSVTDYISDILNRETKNFGVGGITSEAVGLLQGGIPFKLKIDGGKIPKKGQAILHNMEIDPLNKQTSSMRLGLLNGIPGELKREYINEPPFKTIHYLFKRTEKGNKLETKQPVEFQFKDALESRSNTVIIWAGRNDPKKSNEIIKTKENIQKMMDYVKPIEGKKRILVLSVCNGSSKLESKGTNKYKEIIALNELLHKSFGENFIDIRTYLIKEAMADLGLKHTDEDLKEIMSDCIPKSLRSDEVHLNDNGNRAVASFLAKKIQERGF